jgi:hypothetical protein
MKNKAVKTLTPHDYVVQKKGNLIKIVSLIDRTPNMVKLRTPKAA